MTAVSVGDHDAADRIESTLEKWQLRIAKVPGILFQHRWKQKLPKEHIGLAGGKVDSVTLAKPHNAAFVFWVSTAERRELQGIDPGPQERVRRIGMGGKEMKFWARRERLPVFQQGIGFPVNGLLQLVFNQGPNVLRAHKPKVPR